MGTGHRSQGVPSVATHTRIQEVPVAERRIVEEGAPPPGPGRGRGPIIGLIIVFAVALVVLVVFLVSGESDDDSDGVDPADIEVDIGEDE